jgi:hypothetical protein
MFWAIDMILTNCWKIYKSFYGPFLISSGTRLRNTHREFLEALMELLFCCDSEIYVEIAPGTTFKKIRNTAIHLIKLAGNRDIQNQRL